MRFNIGDTVQYNDNEYKIIHIYISDFCEIRENESFKTILVHIDEIDHFIK